MRYILSAAFGGVVPYSFFRWAWPWLAPVLLEPCPPMITAFGCWLLGVVGAVYGLGVALQASERRALRGASNRHKRSEELS